MEHKRTPRRFSASRISTKIGPATKDDGSGANGQDKKGREADESDESERRSRERRTRHGDGRRRYWDLMAEADKKRPAEFDDSDPLGSEMMATVTDSGDGSKETRRRWRRRWQRQRRQWSAAKVGGEGESGAKGTRSSGGEGGKEGRRRCFRRPGCGDGRKKSNQEERGERRRSTMEREPMEGNEKEGEKRGASQWRGNTPATLTERSEEEGRVGSLRGVVNGEACRGGSHARVARSRASTWPSLFFY